MDMGRNGLILIEFDILVSRHFGDVVESLNPERTPQVLKVHVFGRQENRLLYIDDK